MTKHNKIRLTTPGEAAATLAALAGCDPTGSSVLMVIDKTGNLLCTARVDMPAAEEDAAQMTRTLANAVATQQPATRLAGHWPTTGATGAYWTIEAIDDLAAQLGCETMQVRVIDGTATDTVTGHSDPVAATSDALAERDTSQTRDQIATTMEPATPPLDLPAAAIAEVQAIEDDSRRAEVARVAFRVICREHYGTGECIDTEPIARLVTAIEDGHAGDTIIKAIVEEDSPGMAAALAWVARRVPNPAHTYGLAAVAYYLDGDGMRARIAAEHALTADPKTVLARLLITSLDHGIHPIEVRRMLRESF